MVQATKPTQPPASRAEVIPPLQSGERLTRDEFERRYDATPGLKVAELVGGVVHVPSPVKVRDHATPHAFVVGWLVNYVASTPGVETGDNASVRLDLEDEPQPDVFLRILPEHGGQSRTSDDGYVEGAPELVAEVAATSASHDSNAKLNAYRRNGVREYIVWRVLDGALDWLVLRRGGYEPLRLDASGIGRSEVFPGLWLDVPALLRRDMAKVLSVLSEGVQTPEHAAFVERLKGAGPAR